MPLKRVGLLVVLLGCGSATAFAQDLPGVNQGVNSDNDAITGSDINRVEGVNSNGTPRQQDAGASMTNGAGNSYMTPGVTGPAPSNNSTPPAPLPPTAIVHGNEQQGSAPTP